MARKFEVIEADGRRGPQVKKSVAMFLLRRQVAVLLQPFVIKRLSINEQPLSLPKEPLIAPSRRHHEYEHHLEPKTHNFTITDSEWLRYLYGY